jgi:hypothetical protein
VKLLEISNTYRILNCIKPEASDVYAVHEEFGCLRNGLRLWYYLAAGCTTPETNSYLLSAVLQSTGQIEWQAATAG